MSGRRPNGTGYLRPDGYIVLRVGGGRRVYAHRDAWETANGQPIPDGGVIHHGPGGKPDNGPDNLELVSSNSEHLRDKHGEENRARGAAVGKSNKGKPKSAEHRAKISAALKGRAASPSAFKPGHEYHPGRWPEQ
jgi:hypothetical protein